jgi:uncharacterized membrane protein
MRVLWDFVHLFGQTVWIGGSLAAMTLAISGRRELPTAVGTVVRLQSNIYRSLVGPGALLTVLSGMVMTLQRYNQFTAVGIPHALLTMQIVGIAGALIALVHTVPTAAKLARLDPDGPAAPAFGRIRRRLKVSGMTQGVLAFLGLAAAALL